MLTFDQAKRVFQGLTPDQLEQLSAFKAAELMNGFDLIWQGEEFGQRLHLANLERIRKILIEKKGIFCGLPIDLREEKLPDLVDYLADQYRRKTEEFFIFEEVLCGVAQESILRGIDVLAEGFDYHVVQSARYHVLPPNPLEILLAAISTNIGNVSITMIEM